MAKRFELRGSKSPHCLFLLFIVILAACSPKVVVHERIVVQHDTVCIEPVKTYPDGWLGRTQKALDSLCATPLLGESQLGLCILDLTAGVQVYEHGARQRLRPASTMKVVTAVTAMSCLVDNPDAFALRCYATKDEPDIFLVGGMDPLLEYNDLCSLADSLLAAGINHVRNIVLDTSLADTTRWGEGWCWDDENEAMTPFLYKSAKAARGQRGSSLLAWQQAPEAPFVEDLRKAFESRKIKISGSVRRGVNNSTNLVARIGHAWDDVLQPMMKDSNNQFAEAMLRQLGLLSATPSPSLTNITQPFNALCVQLGLDAESYRIADGSGRSLYNYITPELLCRLLNYAALQTWFTRFKAALPVMGVDGTLKRRCHATTAQYKVQAKTGTVTGVSSLAGYATSSEGHLLCFAIINQGVRSGSMGRAFHDEICKIITR